MTARPHARPALTQSHVAQDGSGAHRQPRPVAAGAQGAVEELAQPRRLHPLRREQRVVLQHHAALPEGTPHDESRGGGSDPPGPAPHPGTAAAPQRVTLPVPPRAREHRTLRGCASTYLIPVTSSRRNPGTDMKRGATCAGRKLSAMQDGPRPQPSPPPDGPVPRSPSG